MDEKVKKNLRIAQKHLRKITSELDSMDRFLVNSTIKLIDNIINQ